MTKLARRLLESLRSQLPLRRGRAHPVATSQSAGVRAVGSLIATVLLLSNSAAAASRLDASRAAWTDAPAVAALPAVHSPAIQHGQFGARSARSTWPPAATPFAPEAGQASGLVSASVALASVRNRVVTSVAPRGYDATAPPVS